MTIFNNRLTLIIPANRVASLNAWFRQNIDIGTNVDNITVPLNTTGDETDTPTHFWFSGVFTDDQMDLFLGRLIQQANVTPSDDWEMLSREERKQWLRSVKDTIINRIGVRILHTDNIDGRVIDNLDDLLTEHGIKRRQRQH